MRASEPDADRLGIRVAVMAEALYLLNLLLLPGIAFLLLWHLYRRERSNPSSLARCHLVQTLRASLLAGVLILGVVGVIVGLGGHGSAWTWVAVVLYFTAVHAVLVVMGMLGLARAMAGRHFHFPLVGDACAAEAT